MEVDKVSFPGRLLEVLETLSESHFVSLDCEFSGVASKPQNRHKQTLQERYLKTKQAANRYAILQVGLTCAVLDKSKKTYVLKTYNFPIGPTFDEDLDIERIFSFQSGAAKFLIENRFNFNQALEDGIPYLNRAEEALAKAKFKERWSKDRQYDNIEISEDDTATVEFMKKVKGEIDEWLNDSKIKGGSLEILSRTLHWKKCDHYGDLTAFDKRLIHQLVRADYPELISMGRRSSIGIKPLDEEREAEIKRKRYKDLKRKIYHARGFSWVIEAISGGNLDHIDLHWFTRDVQTGEKRYADTYSFEARFNRARLRLKSHGPVIIGHNIWTDLIYVYRHFIDSLPDTVDKFRSKVHSLFPVVVDTKYLYTHNCGNWNPASSLYQIEEELRVQEKPKIEVHEDYQKYAEEAWHEAGYDAQMTARVAIQLSAKLEAMGTYVLHDKKIEDKPMEEIQAIFADAAINGTEVPWNKVTNEFQPSNNEEDTQHKAASKFASPTMWDVLGTSVDEVDGEEWDNPPRVKAGSTFVLNPAARPFPNVVGDGATDSKTMAAGSNTATNGSRTNGEAVKVDGEEEEEEEELKIDALMPPWESDFWRVYGNKLRVFGTKESLFDLDPERKE